MNDESNITEKNSGGQITNSNEEVANKNISQEQAVEKTETKISTSDITTSDIPNMETHAHELHKAPGHGWKHYFFEFFMLFLAVFCGFLAENVREHSVERNREREYISSLMKDLEYDTGQFDKYINYLKEKASLFDSVFNFLNNPASFNYKLSSKTWLKVYAETYYKPVEPTIQQLKSSGNLRLVENKQVLDSVLAYDSWITGIYNDQTIWVSEAQKSVLQFAVEIFDYHNFNQLIDSSDISHFSDDTTHSLALISKDETPLLKLYNLTVNFKLTNLALSAVLEESKTKAVNLIAFIKKEYHLENE